MKMLTIALFFFATSSTVFGDGAETEQWPKTVDEAVMQILADMSNEDKQRIRGTSKNDLINFHHGWGTWIRNNFGLWGGNNDLIISACGKPCHPDSASMNIIHAVWEHLQNAPVDQKDND